MFKQLVIFIILLTDAVLAQEYKKINRTYINLEEMYFIECKSNFRYINKNWMDCTQSLSLPNQETKLAQITPANYKTQDFTFSVPGTEVEMFISISTTTDGYIEASLGTRLLITAYYLKHGGDRIEKLPAEFYDWKTFHSYLIQALTQLSKAKAWKAQTIAIPTGNNDFTKDQVLSSVHVVRRKIELKISDCQKNYKSWYVDGWPYDRFARTIKFQVTMMESALKLCRQGKAVGYFPSAIVDLHNDLVKQKFQLALLSSPKGLATQKQGIYLSKRKSDLKGDIHKKVAKGIRLVCMKN